MPLTDVVQPVIRSLGGAAGVVVLVLGCWGCGDTSGSGVDLPSELQDHDQDGQIQRYDCDDTNAEVGEAQTYYSDADGDGLGDPRNTAEGCMAPEGFVGNADDEEPDCATNDTDPCGECGGSGGGTYYADSDGDGLGDPGVSVEVCSAPGGFVDNADDAEPGCATNNTDDCGVCGGPGMTTYYADQDGDGQGDAEISIESCAVPSDFVANGDDAEPGCATNDTDDCGVCAGGNAAKDCFDRCFGPAVVDACNICDGPGFVSFYADTDRDGLGDPNDVSLACEQPEGYVLNSDDFDPNCSTNNTDICGVCEGPGGTIYYADVDGDGLGDQRTPFEACGPTDGFVLNADDMEPDCATNDTDECGVCAGANGDQDCNGQCFGEAFADMCERCVGGETGLEAAESDLDEDGTPDLCDEDCLGHARFIVQWSGIPRWSRADGGVGSYSFQAILFENGDIVFQYDDFEEYDASATVGIQNTAGDNVIEFGFNSEFAVDLHAVTMTRERDDRFIADYSLPRYWLDIRQVGVQIEEFGDDDEELFELPFEFPFWNERHDQIFVSSNGFLFFGNPFDNMYSNQELPDANLPSIIAPLWDDFNPGAYGEVWVYSAAATCESDCNDVVGGFAYVEDTCGACITGLDPVVDDCNGDCGGTALIDGCGICAGGNTEVEPQQLDCTGLCGGEAYVDDCRACVGGTTGLEPSNPEDCPQGVDLSVSEDYLRETIYIDYINVNENDCLINERCVRGSGRRKLIRFGTLVINSGTEDLELGTPSTDGPFSEFWHYDECHGHYHFEAYASYELFDHGTMEIDNQGNPVVDDQGNPVVVREGCEEIPSKIECDEGLLDIGSKNGFCILDWAVWDQDLLPDGLDRCRGYNCGNQGITAGCQDTYEAVLQCQWIDVTDMPDGDYDVIVTTNPDGELPEISFDNNIATVRVRMQGDELTVFEDSE